MVRGRWHCGVPGGQCAGSNHPGWFHCKFHNIRRNCRDNASAAIGRERCASIATGPGQSQRQHHRQFYPKLANNVSDDGFANCLSQTAGSFGHHPQRHVEPAPVSGCFQRPGSGSSSDRIFRLHAQRHGRARGDDLRNRSVLRICHPGFPNLLL